MRFSICSAVLAALMIVGCVSGMKGGSGNGRYLVMTDSSLIVQTQFKTDTPQACAQVRALLLKPSGAALAKDLQLDCQTDDQGAALRFGMLVHDAQGTMRLTALNPVLCRYWLSALSGAPGVTVDQRNCDEPGTGPAGRRYLQVRDEHGTVYAQTDLGAEANCIKGAAASRSPAPVVCTDDSRSRDLHYTAVVFGTSGAPALEIETRDNALCDIALRGMAANYSAFRSECRTKR